MTKMTTCILRGVDSSAWCLYRMNLKTQEISEVFKLDNKSNRNYTKLAGI